MGFRHPFRARSCFRLYRWLASRRHRLPSVALPGAQSRGEHSSCSRRVRLWKFNRSLVTAIPSSGRSPMDWWRPRIPFHTTCALSGHIRAGAEPGAALRLPRAIDGCPVGAFEKCFGSRLPPQRKVRLLPGIAPLKILRRGCLQRLRRGHHLLLGHAKFLRPGRPDARRNRRVPR